MPHHPSKCIEQAGRHGQFIACAHLHPEAIRKWIGIDLNLALPLLDVHTHDVGVFEIAVEVHLFETVVVKSGRWIFMQILVTVLLLAVASAGELGEVLEGDAVGAVLDEEVGVLGFGGGAPFS